MKQKITLQEYNKKMDKFIDKNLPVNDVLITMLEEASKYTIIEKKHEKHTSKIQTTRTNNTKRRSIY